MGISSDGEIAFGIDLGEEGEVTLPWSDHEEIEDWWAEANGFLITHPEPNSDDDAGWERWFDARAVFLAENPLPVQLVLHCSYECPMYVLAVPGTNVSASRGYPVEIKLTEPDPQPLLDFCKEHGIEVDTKPAWLLFSVYG